MLLCAQPDVELQPSEAPAALGAPRLRARMFIRVPSRLRSDFKLRISPQAVRKALVLTLTSYFLACGRVESAVLPYISPLVSLLLLTRTHTHAGRHRHTDTHTASPFTFLAQTKSSTQGRLIDLVLYQIKVRSDCLPRVSHCVHVCNTASAGTSSSSCAKKQGATPPPTATHPPTSQQGARGPSILVGMAHCPLRFSDAKSFVIFTHTSCRD